MGVLRLAKPNNVHGNALSLRFLDIKLTIELRSSPASFLEGIGEGVGGLASMHRC